MRHVPLVASAIVILCSAGSFVHADDQTDELFKKLESSFRSKFSAENDVRAAENRLATANLRVATARAAMDVAAEARGSTLKLKSDIETKMEAADKALKKAETTLAGDRNNTNLQTAVATEKAKLAALAGEFLVKKQAFEKAEANLRRQEGVLKTAEETRKTHAASLVETRRHLKQFSDEIVKLKKGVELNRQSRGAVARVQPRLEVEAFAKALVNFRQMESQTGARTSPRFVAGLAYLPIALKAVELVGSLISDNSADIESDFELKLGGLIEKANLPGDKKWMDNVLKQFKSLAGIISDSDDPKSLWLQAGPQIASVILPMLTNADVSVPNAVPVDAIAEHPEDQDFIVRVYGELIETAKLSGNRLNKSLTEDLENLTTTEKAAVRSAYEAAWQSAYGDKISGADLELIDDPFGGTSLIDMLVIRGPNPEDEDKYGEKLQKVTANLATQSSTSLLKDWEPLVREAVTGIGQAKDPTLADALNNASDDEIDNLFKMLGGAAPTSQPSAGPSSKRRKCCFDLLLGL